LHDRAIRLEISEEQGIGRLQNVRALTHHLANIFLSPQLIGRKDVDLELAALP
jgi:hypothetical protein